MADPVAWIVVESGWKVSGRDGAELGQVKEVFGEEDADIFDGLLVTQGRLRSDHYLPAERITAIYEGLVETDLDDGELEGLDRLAPGSVRVSKR